MRPNLNADADEKLLINSLWPNELNWPACGRKQGLDHVKKRSKTLIILLNEESSGIIALANHTVYWTLIKFAKEMTCQSI